MMSKLWDMVVQNMNKIGTARHPEEIIKLKLNTNIDVVKYSMLRIKVGD